MSTIRIRKSEKFFSLSNEPVNDGRLSFGARGLLTYLLSKPDGWKVRNNDLYRKSPDGKARIQRYLSELKKYGYLARYRVSSGKGEIAWVSDIFESPSDNPHFSMSQNTDIENTNVEKTGDIVSTDSYQVLNQVNTDLGASAKNGLDDYFEPKPPIEPTPLKPPLKDRIKDKDPELLMTALGVTAISRAAPGEVLIKDSGWIIGNDRIRLAIAQFIDATGLPVPAKTERGKWLKQAQLHLEEFKVDDLPRLYRESWGEYKPQVLAGHIDITHPGALTTKMRAILQRQKIKVSEMTTQRTPNLSTEALSRYQQLRAEEQVGR